MTLEECRVHLPHGWTEAIQRDPVLLELFEEHEYELEREEVPPFLIQSLRGWRPGAFAAHPGPLRAAGAGDAPGASGD